jgi:hypothetical protein
VYAIGVTAAMSSFVIGYSHVFLSQMEAIIKNKNELSLEQLALTLTIVVSATNLGEVIGRSFPIQVPLCISGSLSALEKQER